MTDQAHSAAGAGFDTSGTSSGQRAALPRSGRSWSLIIATVWLLISIAFGVAMALVNVESRQPTLTAHSEHSAYGGDAYTGIQNAAADTEAAVVRGTRQLATYQHDLNKWERYGLGFLAISLAMLNLTVALGRQEGKTLSQ